jgi:hypothetical protein
MDQMMLGKCVSVALVASSLATTDARATNANKACADGLVTFRRLFVSDSGVARILMNGFRNEFNAPADVTFADLVDEVRKVGAEGFLNELVEAEATRNGVQPDAVRRANAAKLESMKAEIPIFDALPELYDRYFIFRGVTAVDYDAGLDRATCEVRYSIDYPFFRQWNSKVNNGATLPPDVERLAQIQQAAEQAGEYPMRHFTVQPDGRGHNVISLLTK